MPRFGSISNTPRNEEWLARAGDPSFRQQQLAKPVRAPRWQGMQSAPIGQRSPAFQQELTRLESAIPGGRQVAAAPAGASAAEARMMEQFKRARAAKAAARARGVSEVQARQAATDVYRTGGTPSPKAAAPSRAEQWPVRRLKVAFQQGYQTKEEPMNHRVAFIRGYKEALSLGKLPGTDYDTNLGPVLPLASAAAGAGLAQIGAGDIKDEKERRRSRIKRALIGAGIGGVAGAAADIGLGVGMQALAQRAPASGPHTAGKLEEAPGPHTAGKLEEAPVEQSAGVYHRQMREQAAVAAKAEEAQQAQRAQALFLQERMNPAQEGALAAQPDVKRAIIRRNLGLTK